VDVRTVSQVTVTVRVRPRVSCDMAWKSIFPECSSTNENTLSNIKLNNFTIVFILS